MTSWVKKEKQEKASFCLRLKKKKAQTLLITPHGGSAQVGLCWWVQQPGWEDEAWSSNLTMNLSSFFSLLSWIFFKTFSNSLGVTQAPGSSAGRCRVRDRRDTGHKRRCVNSNEKAPIRTTKTTIRGPLTGQREGAHPYRSEKLPPSLQKIQ